MQSLLHNFDKGLATKVAKLPDWTTPVFLACTYLGLPVVVVTASLIVALVCYTQGNKNASLAFGLATAALGANGILKLLVHRSRPETLYVQSMAIKSYSFPSGHAFGSMVFYGLIAFVCYQHLDKPMNIVAAGLLSLLIFAIGVSRISLGAHFPSDVLVGWILGAVTLLLIIKVCAL